MHRADAAAAAVAGLLRWPAAASDWPATQAADGRGERRRAVATATPAVRRAGTTMARAERGRQDHGRHQVRPARLRPEEPATATPEGFDVEIAKIIAGELGIEAEQDHGRETVSANREPFIQNGQVDIVVATYTITDDPQAGRRLRRPVLRGRPGHHGRQGQPDDDHRARTTWTARRSARSRARPRPRTSGTNYPKAQLTSSTSTPSAPTP